MSEQQPYIGPKPFGPEDQKLFFGRDREEGDLLALIRAHPVVILYAQSGAGKTSLLEAKLVPDLEALNAQVFRGVRVGGHLPPDIDPNKVDNVFVFNAVMTLRENPGSASDLVKVSLADAMGGAQKSTDEEDELLRVVIFDQFEEIFTTYPERWNDRKAFFGQLASALKTDPSLHVVFAIREEYLASMIPYANDLPGRLRTGLRLERLRRDDALAAVVNPLQTTDRSFAKDAAETLVKNLMSSAEYVEPLHLQVVCRNLWQSLDPATKVITTASIQSYGDLDAALRRYYEECVSKTVSARNVAEVTLRNWFQNHLILEGNKRNLVPQGSEATAGLPNDVVKLLDEQHLIRPELRGGTVWYEIAHDRFLRPILEANLEWWRAKDAIGLELQKEAQAWRAANRSSERLLTGARLEEARRWRVGRGDEFWKAAGLTREYIEASESHDKHRRLRSLVRAYSIQVGVLLAGLILLLILFMQAKKAERAAKRAEGVAIDAQGVANSLRNQAEQTKLIERGLFATSLVESETKRPRQFDALVWGIKAMGPSLAKGAKDGSSPPPLAKKGLQDATRPLGDATLFVTSSKAAPEFFPDNKHLLASANGQIDLIDVATGSVRWHKELAKDVEYFQATISPDSSQILASATLRQPKAGANPTQEDPEAKGAKRKMWLLAVATGEPIESGSLADLTDGFFGWGGASLVAWKELETKNYLLRILNAKTLQVVREMNCPGLDYLSISPDGKLLATLVENGVVQLWETGNDNPPRNIKLKETKPSASVGVMFSPDGQRLLVSETARATIFDVATSRQVSAPEILPYGSIYFTPDSKLIVSATRRKILRIDATTGETREVRELADVEKLFLSEDLSRALCIRSRASALANLSIVELDSGTVVPIPPQPLQGDEITASFNLDMVATVDAEGIGRIVTISKPPPDLSKVTDRELLQIACRQLRFRIERGDVTDDEVKAICAEHK